MGYRVKIYNDHYVDVYIHQFMIARIDREYIDDKLETERQAHKRISNFIKNLNGEWLFGEMRSRRYPENNLVRNLGVTIPADQENDNFIPIKKLTAINGDIKISNV